jgi:REP element-mobilizing transposase RayT
MPRPRKQQISLDATPFYHCVSRCVRRAFICGKDPLSGRSYEHRRHQIKHDLLRLASIFYIDLVAFCVMSNHHHVVVHVDRQRCCQAKPKEIALRWHQLFKAKVVSQKFVDGEPLEPHEQYQLDTLIDTWRSRLHDISWFMKVLNEKIARMANKEDDCTGHFWESRFKSQALLDEKAVLSAMAYVDLNPIRTAMASTPETSDHTSIKLRVEHWKEKAREYSAEGQHALQPASLLPFAGNHRQPMPRGLAFNLIDYIELVDWTGRIIRDDKRGAVAENTPPILQRLNIPPDHWMELSTNFQSRFKGIAGCCSGELFPFIESGGYPWQAVPNKSRNAIRSF